MDTVEATSSTEAKPEKTRRDGLNLTDGGFAVVFMLVAAFVVFHGMKLIEAASEGNTVGGFATNGFLSGGAVVLLLLFTNLGGIAAFVAHFPPFHRYVYENANFTTAKRVFSWMISVLAFVLIGATIVFVATSLSIEKQVRVEHIEEQGYSNVERYSGSGNLSYIGVKDGKEYLIMYNPAGEADNKILTVEETKKTP